MYYSILNISLVLPKLDIIYDQYIYVRTVCMYVLRETTTEFNPNSSSTYIWPNLAH